jgi:hypothetical protein
MEIPKTVILTCNYTGIQESEFRSQQMRFFNFAQVPLEETSPYLILVHDLAHGDVSKPTRLIEEAGKLLKTYMRAILNSVYLSSYFDFIYGPQWQPFNVIDLIK